NLGGEQLTVTYTDPLYTSDVAIGNAQYAGKTVATPTILPVSGTWFQDDTTFTLSTTTGGTSIHYTLDGSQPDETTGLDYSGGVFIDAGTTIRAVAYISNGAGNFAISNDTLYTLNKRGDLGIPYANPASTYFTEDTTVFLVPGDSSNNIWYTTNGVDPDSTDGVNSTRYDYNGSGISISGDSVDIKFYATYGTNVPSSIVTETYLKRDTLTPPVFTPASTTFLTDTSVVLSHGVANTTIYYTTDGSTPTTASNEYDGPISVTGPTTIKAIAYNLPAYVQSAVDSAEYMPILTIIATPASQNFDFQQSVVLSSNEGTATIYYTLDNTSPDSSEVGSTIEYTGTPILLTETTTIKAIAVKTDWRTSDVFSQTYTRSSTASLLELLDSNGTVVPNNVLKGDQSKYAVRISTNFGGSSTLTPLAVTTGAGDSETLSLVTITGSSASYARIFRDKFSFVQGTASASDGILQTSHYDTIVVTWTNPLDGGDVVVDSLFVQPADNASKVYFATGLLLTDTTSSLTESNTTIYVIVTDQQAHSDSSFTALITTPTGDSETVALTWQNSMLVGSIVANYNTTAVNDGSLQINLGGEQLTARYADPLYTVDVSTKTAQYAGKSIATPAILPISGTWFQDDTTFTLATGTVGADIHYTLEGTVPDQSTGNDYSGAVSISATTTIRAIAYIYYSASNYAVSNDTLYTLKKRAVVDNPYAVPATTYFTEDTVVFLVPASPDSSDKIYYTTNGSDPDSATSTLYDYNGTGIAVSTDSVDIRFYSTNGTSVPSSIISETYLKRDTLTPPVFNPGTTTYLTDTSVILSHPVSGTKIYYTLDGTTPTSSSQLYKGAITLSTPVTIKAIAYNLPAWVESAVDSASYMPILTVAATPSSQSFDFQQEVVLTANEGTANIYYTLDGSAPDSSVTVTTYKYDGSPVLLTATTTIKAIAVKTDWRTSDELEVTYTRTSTASLLQLLDSNGIALTNNILKGNQSKYAVKISTNFGGTGALSPVAVTVNAGDSEPLSLSTMTGSGGGYSRVYFDKYDFSQGTVSASDGTLQAADYDTIVVSWTNPLDAGDIVVDTLFVQPSNQSSKVYMATGNQLDDTTSTFSEGNTTIYILATDQQPHTDSSFSALLTTPTGDSETVTLTWQGTLFVGSITVSYDSTKVNNGELQVNLGGEQIAVRYADPLYPADVATDEAQYAGKLIATPAIIPISGTWFQDDTTFTLATTTGGAGIHYTLNGSTPDESVGIDYNGPVSINTTVSIRVVAYMTNGSNNFALSNDTN
ncbi:MAG: chitobiase/beta-hexosaminidase C-terminal domain-containing protein, partial [Fibrobacteria bacterium]|nr:chitobiase/beta-hexosaminidase C-terminal domain-containing protein [Fibrobacteria bacterium]